MSRVANQPVELPKGVELNIASGQITAKGSNGTLTQRAHPTGRGHRDSALQELTREARQQPPDQLLDPTDSLFDCWAAVTGDFLLDRQVKSPAAILELRSHLDVSQMRQILAAHQWLIITRIL